ncbi:MAG: radical SAM protein [Burkholderiaceae bacterium]
MWQVNWTVKASKFCNLRCAYCYEWDELARREQIAPDQWEHIFTAASRYHQLQWERFEEPGRSHIVWHGGEPLLLAPSYMESVLERQRYVFGADALAQGELQNVLQTNLVAVTDSKLDLLAREKFRLGVSLDWLPGVRLDLRGRETEARVMQNLARVLERGIPVVVSTVLAGHTIAHLPRIHGACAELGVPLHLIPMFKAPHVSSQASFATTDGAIADALGDLFDHWMAAGCPVRVEPISTYLVTVLQRISGLERPALGRRVVGETFLTVNTNGDVYQPRERYVTGRSLGNLFRQSIDEILASPAYAASLERDAELLVRHCRQCRYRGGCEGYPVLARPHHWADGPCPIASRVCNYIEGQLRADDLDELTIREWLPMNEMATATLGVL